MAQYPDYNTNNLQMNGIPQNYLSGYGLPQYNSVFSAILKRLTQSQTGQQDWLNQMLARTTGDLSRSLGEQFSRTNVPVAAGTDVLASRYLSPLSRMITENKPSGLEENIFSALGLTSAMQPMVGKRRPEDIEKMLRMLLNERRGGW